MEDTITWSKSDPMQLSHVIHATVAILFVSVLFGHIYIGTLGVEGDCRVYPEDNPMTVEHMLEPTGTVEKLSPRWKRSVLLVVVIGLQQRKEKRS